MTRITLPILLAAACQGDPVRPVDNNDDTGTTPPVLDADRDGFSTADGDCNDTDPAVNPDAEEVCDDVDNNCDGSRDEGVQVKFYADRDGDGFGGQQDGLDRDDFAYTCTPDPPAGYAVAPDDCDDSNAYVHPGAIETCDGQDNDCNGQTDEAGDGRDDQDADGVLDCIDPDFCPVGGRVNDGTMWANDAVYGPQQSFGPWWVPLTEGLFVARMDETTSYEAYYLSYYEWDADCGGNGWDLCGYLRCDSSP
jgi:hypothetical protein